MDPNILFSIIKLVASGIVTFLAILLMSKTRDAAWTCLVCGFLFSFAALIFDVLVFLGVISHLSILVLGIPLSALICVLLPNLFYIVAFILMLIKKY